MKKFTLLTFLSLLLLLGFTTVQAQKTNSNGSLSVDEIETLEVKQTARNAAMFVSRTPATTPAIQAPAAIPELLYYKFDEAGASVTNMATAPPAGTATATINGSLSQGVPAICDVGSLQGTGSSSTTNFVATGWNSNLGAGSWTIAFKTKDIAPSSTLYYIFGDPAASSFRCFTNGVAGAGNWWLRGPVTDVPLNGGAAVAGTTSVFVYDSAASEIRAYLDGVLVNTVAQGAVNISGSAFKVGGYSGSTGLAPGAAMDEFRVYNRALSPAEVADLTPCPTSAPGPIAECGNAPEPIPAGAPGSSSGLMTPSVAVVADAGVIGSNPGEYTLDNVTLNINHTWADDLEIVLVSPAGTRVALTTDNGSLSGLDTAADLVFRDNSANNVTGWDGGAPLANYRAEGGGNTFPVAAGDGPGVNLNTVFAGQSITGNWTIEINDDAGGDFGQLNSYCITFNPNLGDPPLIVCPADISTDTDPGQCNAVVNFSDAIALDPEDGPIPTTQTSGLPSGSMFPVGVSTVEFSATDSDGNTSTCSFTITVIDMEAPVAVCQDITVELDPVTGSVTIVPADVDGGSTDNCGIVTYSLDVDTFTCADTGANTVNLTVTDAEGNSSSCAATVTVEDNTAPVILCVGEPGDLVVSEDFEGAGLPPGWSTVIVSGGFDWTFGSPLMPGGADFTSNAAIFDDDAAGSGETNNTVELYSPVTDLTGAVSANLSFDYSMQVFVTSGELYVEVWDGAAWQQILFVDVDTPPTSSGVIDAMPYANSAFQVRFRYDDEDDWAWGAGVDNYLLEYSLPVSAYDVILDANGMATIQASDLLASVNEACGWTATVGGPATSMDVTECGNAPEAIPAGAPGTTSGPMNPSIATVADAGVIGTDYTLDRIEVNLIHTWASDIEMTLQSPAGTTLDVMFDRGGSSGLDVAATLVFTDASSNDVTLWTSNANGPLADYQAEGGLFNTVFAGESITGDWTLLINDDAGGDTGMMNSYCITFSAIIDTTVSFDCSQLGENQVEVFVTDDGGNFTSCIATVNVIDETSPILVCWDVTIELGPDGTAEVDPADLLAVTEGVYDIMVIGSDNSSGTEGFTDFTVPVTEAANITFDWDYTLNDAPGFDSFGYLLNGVYTMLTDPGLGNQSGSAAVAVAPGDVFGFRSQTDDNIFGNNETVISNFVPGFTGQFDPANWTLTLTNSDGDAFFVEVIPPGPLSYDACGITVLAVDVTEVTCADIGTPVTATVFASDASGNIASCQSIITVVDLLAPELVCPADQTVDPGAGNLFYEVPDYFGTGEASATDNCTDPVVILSQSPPAGTLLPDGVYPVTITAEDEYGNESTCVFTLTVETILGVDDNNLDVAIVMYPNPAQSQVTIANNSTIALDKAAIYDINGKLVMTIDLQTMQGEKVIDISRLASGVYMVQISSDQASVVKRLIKE